MNNQNASAKSPDLASIKESVQTLVDHSGEAVDAIKSKVNEVSGEAREKAAAAYDSSVQFIQANPGKAIAIAFGLGYIAMRIRTSPLFPVAVIGGLGYLTKKKLAA